MNTIFHTLSIDRAQVQWESYLDDITPISEGDVLRYKRDDLWAPLGVGGINGFKVRQGVWLLSTVARQAKGLIFGGSVKSTQHAMVATVARHFGKTSVHVLGATTPETYGRHESVAIAQQQGAQFDLISIAYTAALQRRITQLLATPAYADYFRVEYAVGFDHHVWPLAQVRAYHAIGAAQVQNLPDDIETLVIPTGSGHAAISILLGLAHYSRTPAVHLVGIGPSRLAWMAERLKLLGVEADFSAGRIRAGNWSVPVTFHDLIGTGYTTYQTLWNESRDGMTFHRTYEAKMMRWLREHGTALITPRTLVWIVGAEPRLAHMTPWAVEAPLKSAI